MKEDTPRHWLAEQALRELKARDARYPNSWDEFDDDTLIRKYLEQKQNENYPYR